MRVEKLYSNLGYFVIGELLSMRIKANHHSDYDENNGLNLVHKDALLL